MYASLRAALFGFAIISTATRATAVQLASFTPRIDIQNAQCRAAYTTTIDGCTPNDFVMNAVCSTACVQGLAKIGEVIKRVCRDVDVGETSIIGVFQNDIGIKALCPGVSVTTISPIASSTKAVAQSSTQPSASKVTTTSAAPPESTLATSISTSTLTSASQSEAAQSSSTSSQGLVTDPNATSGASGSPTNVARPPASSTAATGPTRAPNAQLSNADSGGGSPFDVQAGAGSSARLRGVDLMMAAFVGTALLFVACA